MKVLMKYTKIPVDIQKQLQKFIATYSSLSKIIELLHSKGAVVLLVGGAVRDLFLQHLSKDFDIEVHGLSVKELEEVLRTFGYVDEVGKAYGVLRIHGLDIDWSIPRRDKEGRKPDVVVDPWMSMEDAFRRRDLTMNAMGINLITYELIDPFGGLEDMRNKVLRAPDTLLFAEDPLRFYRVMQFCARFGMQPDAELNALCSTMDVSGVSRERIETECAKWLLKSSKPSLALTWLVHINRLADIFPEIAATQGVVQSSYWHPEGDVFEHTQQAVDAAALLEYNNDHEKLIMLYAALCHDLGKVTTTEIIENKITSYGHAQVGAELAKKFLKRIMRTKNIIDAVVKLVHYHMEPLQFVHAQAGLPAYKRLAQKLAPEVTMYMLAQLARADKRARNPEKGSPLNSVLPEIDAFIERARKAKVLEAVEQPILLGRDLLDVVKPGRELGNLVRHAYKIQIDEGITDKDELKKRILEKL